MRAKKVKTAAMPSLAALRLALKLRKQKEKFLAKIGKLDRKLMTLH